METDGATGRPMVRAAVQGSPADQTRGPHVVHVTPGAAPHTVQVTYDCDMEPSSVAGANLADRPDGQPVEVTTSYDPQTRTVTVTLPPSATGQVMLTVTTGLRDINGQHLATPMQSTFTFSDDIPTP